jgi:cytochrome d ubiquinol oxidase subunit II
MLIGLVLRGVAFEFRWRTRRGQFLWDWAFSGGSLIATFAQGMALGALVQGIPVVNRAYAGGWWDWVSPFTLLTGVALVMGYALLGSTWLVMKTEGELQEKSRSQAWFTAAATVILIGAVSLWTPFLEPIYFARWFAWPAMLFSAIVPLLVLVCVYGLYTGLRDKRDYRPFLSSLGLFVLCFVGLGISFYPYIVPPSLSIWDAAAPDKSLGFLLVGALVLMPLILAYTAYSYWVFRGKVDPHEGYH